MTIEVICRCGQRYATADEYGGQTLTCPNCGGPILVPHSPGTIPPGMEFCNYCHQYIPRGQMSPHVAEHLRPQEDGQQSEYATLPAEERASETEAADAPQWYLHTKCGEVTGMPDEIIQTYLANPWFYMGDFTYCGGCERHVPLRQCVWEETGENLQTYTNRLRAAKPELRPSIYIRLVAWFVNVFRR
jgi:DNA-directed RNA polymerase subunit RPC12/RpoP